MDGEGPEFAATTSDTGVRVVELELGGVRVRVGGAGSLLAHAHLIYSICICIANRPQWGSATIRPTSHVLV